MIRLIALAFLLCLTGAPCALAAMNIQRVISPGGIEAWLVEEHQIPLIALQLGFRGGASGEPLGREGAASMLAALLDEGAGDLDAKAFQEALADKAIQLSFSSDRDNFFASAGTLSANRDQAFALLSKALTKPRFDDAPVARVRAQLLARLQRESTDPGTIAAKKWFETAFPRHVYGRSTHGTAQSIAAISVADLKALSARIIAQDRLYVAVVGDIDAKTLARMLDDTLGGLPKSSAADDIADITPAAGKKPIVIKAPNPQSVVVFGNKGLKRDDPDFYAAYVLNYIVGGGSFASRLTHEVREKRGLAYSVSTSLVPMDHAGLMLGELGTANAQVGEALSLVRSEFRKIVKDGVTPDELADAKTYLTGSYPLRFSSNSKIASELVGIQLEKLGIDYVERRNRLIEAVTLQDLKRVAPRILDAGQLVVTVVGGPKGL